MFAVPEPYRTTHTCPGTPSRQSASPSHTANLFVQAAGGLRSCCHPAPGPCERLALLMGRPLGETANVVPQEEHGLLRVRCEPVKSQDLFQWPLRSSFEKF